MFLSVYSGALQKNSRREGEGKGAEDCRQQPAANSQPSEVYHRERQCENRDLIELLRVVLLYMRVCIAPHMTEIIAPITPPR